MFVSYYRMLVTIEKEDQTIDDEYMDLWSVVVVYGHDDNSDHDDDNNNNGHDNDSKEQLTSLFLN